MTTLVDGNALARTIRAATAASFAELRADGHPEPRVAIVVAPEDQAAAQYTRRLQKSFLDAGVTTNVHELGPDTSCDAAVALLRSLSADPSIHGIQIQVPLPAGIPLAALLEALAPAKDLDGIHPFNAGLLAQGAPAIAPATPAGGMEILRHHEVPVSGARAVVVGRSTPVGRPMALLLVQADATVTVCHSRTRDLGAVTREADILAVAAGRAGLISADMVKPGATVIDFGVNFVDGKMAGDVNPAAAEVASLFTPVPGGTGPVTTAMLLRNALTLYRRSLGLTA